LEQIINSAEPGFDRAFLETAINTGARHSEILAMTWRDINFEERTIKIQRNWQDQYENEKPVFTTVKSLKRRLDGSAELISTLKRWKLACPISPYDLVFPQADGRPYFRKRGWHALDNAITIANQKGQKLRRLTIHALRHSFASILVMANVSPLGVSEMLGHRDKLTVFKVYTHFVPQMKTNTANLYAGLIYSISRAEAAAEAGK
jgi:integrase